MDDNWNIETYLWETDLDTMCNSNPEYKKLKLEIEGLSNIIKSLVGSIFIKYDVKKNAISVMEIEAAYKKGYLEGAECVKYEQKRHSK